MSGMGDAIETGGSGDRRGGRWAVVGGGMLGLTLALRLAQQGKQVTVLEAAPNWGGLASAWRLGDVTWDRHYHVTLLSDSHLRRVLDELGLGDDMDWVTTRTGVFADGKLYSVSNTIEMLRFPVLGWLDTFRLGATILWASRVRSWRRLERIPVAKWLARWSGRRTFERFWLPLLRSKLGEAYHETSAAFIWATIQRLYAARRSGLKRELFGYVHGGYARVLDRFVERLTEMGVALRSGCPVARVESNGAEVKVEVRGQGVETFDHVVVTTAAPLAARLCPGLSADELERLRGVRYLGIVCASLLLRRPLAGFYVTNLLDPALPFTGVIEMSALVDPRYLGGHGLVYLPRYLLPDDPFFEAPDEEVRQLFEAGLRRVYPELAPEDVLAFRVSRVRQVMALPTLGYSERVPRSETSAPGVHLVGSAQIVNGTLNVNETVQLAEQAARRFASLP
jgi:protoporphyrinogen oxidase